MTVAATKIRIAEALGKVSVAYSDSAGGDATVQGVWLGQSGALRLEVCELISTTEPSVQTIRAAWHKRRARRGVPLMLFWEGASDVLITEPIGDPQTVSIINVSASAALAIIQRALRAPHREAVQAVLSLLERTQGSAGIAGFRNRNLLSTHYVTDGYRRDHPKEWAELSVSGAASRKEQGARLLRALGFTPTANVSAFEVRGDGRLRVHALVLPEGAAFDRSAAGPGDAPATRLLIEARDKQAERAILVSGRVIRIYVADVSKGVDDIATASTYIELDLEILPNEWNGLLPLLFNADSHESRGRFDRLVEGSVRYAIGLRTRFSERVYENVVAGIAKALYESRGRRKAEAELLYHATLLFLYRLLFVLYAEDRNLLPLANSEYRRRSLTQNLLRLDEWQREKKPFDPRQTTYWDELFDIFDAIRSGSHEWNIPAYNGGLFEPELDGFPEAAFLNSVKIPNAKLAPLLIALAFDEQKDVRGKIDFGDLGVRHLGTLYEGLLSYTVRIAEENLSIDRDGMYVPAQSNDEIAVSAGDPYLISPKGGRKLSGSYYTPSFLVRQLIDDALTPRLESHLQHVAAMPPEKQWQAMLDFRIVDPAMGSGHFLVDALDAVSDRFTTFLKDNPRISAEPILKAREQITEIGSEFGIEALGSRLSDFELLRRNVMRNCIYGVDLNPMAVELAKLGLWLHAFVPGLPLSYLGHNLQHGNALVGIVGDEIDEQLGDKLFGTVVTATLNRALIQAKTLANLSDLSVDEVKASEKAQDTLKTTTLNLCNAFDAYACRMFAVGEPDMVKKDRERGRSALERGTGLQDVLSGALSGIEKKQIAKAQKIARELSALHWQLVFPEVFLRENPGFDVILGNPPWDKVLFEEQQFWVSRAPGLNSLPAAARSARIEQLRRDRAADAAVEAIERAHRENLQVYFGEAFVSQGRGHFDLSKLFMERVLRLKSQFGAIGYVLPGAAMVLGGWDKLREILTTYEMRVTEARNTGGWIFADAEGRMIVAPVSIARSPNHGTVVITPGINSLRDLETSLSLPSISLLKSDLDALSDDCIIPWLNSSAEVSVLNKMRIGRSLASGRGWITGQSDAKWDFTGSGRDNVFLSPSKANDSWKGLMARHVDQYALDESKAFQHVIGKPAILVGANKDVVLDGRRVVLGRRHPRIVYRYPARADDSRTLIATLLPKIGFLPNTGYIHAVNTGDSAIENVLALLGYMNSLACDWWIRRFVDRHVSAPVINGMPLPNWGRKDIADVACAVVSLLSSNAALAREFNVEPTVAARETDACRLFIEQSVAHGFDLEDADMHTILADFSDTSAVAPMSVLQGLRR